LVGTEDILGMASQVLGLGLYGQVLGLGLESQVLGLGLGGQVLGLGLVTSGLDSKSGSSTLCGRAVLRSALRETIQQRGDTEA